MTGYGLHNSGFNSQNTYENFSLLHNVQTVSVPPPSKAYCSYMGEKRPRRKVNHSLPSSADVNLLQPTGHVMHQQFNIQQLYVLPTLYLCDLYLSENKQRLVPLTA